MKKSCTIILKIKTKIYENDCNRQFLFVNHRVNKVFGFRLSGVDIC